MRSTVVYIINYQPVNGFYIGHWLHNHFFGWPRFGFLVTYGLLNQIIKILLHNYLSRAYISVYNWCSTTCQSFHIFVLICFNAYNVGSKNCFRGEGVSLPPLGLGTCLWLHRHATACYKFTESIWNCRTS